jgi:hypothetical protein
MDTEEIAQAIDELRQAIDELIEVVSRLAGDIETGRNTGTVSACNEQDGIEKQIQRLMQDMERESRIA